MKTNKINILLIIIIIFLISIIVYNHLHKENTNINKEEVIKVVEKIDLEYLSVYLFNDGNSFIVPYNKEKIATLNLSKNLSSRLNTLYDQGIYYDYEIDNYKLKGYKLDIDAKVDSIYKINIEDNIYLIFLKNNHTIAIFNYDDYYNLLHTNVTDNYKDIKDVLDIKDDFIIYLDGSKESLINLVEEG